MKQSKIFSQIASVYIVLPFLIFVSTWIKSIIAIPLLLCVLYCLYKVCKDSPELWMPEWSKQNILKIIIICLFIILWCYSSGVGKYVFQNPDHMWRNTIFNILVEYDWPVINYEIIGDNIGKMEASGMIYYIGFWLPSAVIGKIFGVGAGYFAQLIWAVMGIILVYYFICVHQKKVLIWPLFVFIFFSGLDALGIFIKEIGMDTVRSWNTHLEWWGGAYQYSSMTTQLYWTFNQSIPAWLCTILAYSQKNNRNLVFILACCMLTSTIPFVGLLLLVVFWCLERKYECKEAMTLREKGKKYVISLIKDTCTVQNVLGGGIIGIMSFIYLCGNSSAGQVGMKGYQNNLSTLFVFLLVDIGIYFQLIYQFNKKNKIYYYNLVCLCIIPLIRVGYSNDFCMRASIPALFLLTLWVVDALKKTWEQRKRVLCVGIIFALLIGAATPLAEMYRTITETYTRKTNGQTVYAEDRDSVSLLNESNFSGDIEDNFFFKYFAK
ncbi:MAG: hypothetical protein IJZ53_13835 [Tyzzerella sp.]|nr:hypothetical protein [Tyzzerella sp.]